MFALIFLALLGSLYGYAGWRLIPYLPPSIQVGAALALVFLLLTPLLLFRLRSRPHLAWLTDPLSWVAYLGMGFFIVCSTLLVLRDIGGLLLGLVYPIDAALNTSIDLATFALALVAAGYGYYQARRTPAVRRVDVPIADLPPALVGLRIVQISDLHVGPTIKAPFVERVVARVNELQPDLIAFTGDLADGPVERLAPHTAALAELTAPLGVYFCTGNHEYYSGVESWTAQARRLGFDVLINEMRQIDCGGGRIALAGTTDFSAGELVPRPRIGPGQGPCRKRRSRCAHPARASAAQHRGRQPSRLPPATVRPHPRRSVRAMEVRNPPPAALCRGSAQIPRHLDLRPPRHRLLGAATAARCPFRNRTPHPTSGRVRMKPLTLPATIIPLTHH